MWLIIIIIIIVVVVIVIIIVIIIIIIIIIVIISIIIVIISIIVSNGGGSSLILPLPNVLGLYSWSLPLVPHPGLCSEVCVCVCVCVWCLSPLASVQPSLPESRALQHSGKRAGVSGASGASWRWLCLQRVVWFQLLTCWGRRRLANQEASLRRVIHSVSKSRLLKLLALIQQRCSSCLFMVISGTSEYGAGVLSSCATHRYLLLCAFAHAQTHSLVISFHAH
ncbi:hypothetical protein SRHO_G00188930 [Serrasalmus rhombeus]